MLWNTQSIKYHQCELEITRRQAIPVPGGSLAPQVHCTPMPHTDLREICNVEYLVVVGVELDPHADEEATVPH
jgi:hypothetical protein